MYNPNPVSRFMKDESELLSSDPASIARARKEAEEVFIQRGYEGLEEYENR